MPVRLAESAGFCFGVNNAVNQVYRLLDEGEKVCTLGPIIHNPQVVDKLAARGVTIVDDPAHVPDGSVLVIRSHGVPESTYRQVEDSPSALETFYYGRSLMGLHASLEERRAEFAAVTAEDVARVAGSLTADVTYFLEGTQEDGEDYDDEEN